MGLEKRRLCKTRRPQEFCIGLSEVEKVPCGFPGIAEDPCAIDYKCCYDPTSSIQCFKPAGSQE